MIMPLPSNSSGPGGTEGWSRVISPSAIGPPSVRASIATQFASNTECMPKNFTKKSRLSASCFTVISG